MNVFEKVSEGAFRIFDWALNQWWQWKIRRNGWVLCANERDYDRVPSRAAPSLPASTAELPDASMSECVVLGALLEEPTLIPRTLARLNGDVPFNDERCKLLFDTIKDLAQSGAHLDFPTICLHFEKRALALTKNPEISARFLAWASSLPEKSLGEGELLEHHLRDVLDAHVKRRLLAMMDEARAALGDVPAGHVLAGLIDAGRYLQRQIPSSMPAVDVSELLADPPAEPPVLVDGLLHQADVMMIGGQSKSFKSWFALDMLMCISHGIPWLGFTVPQPVNTLYLSFELADWMLAGRLSAIAEARGITMRPGAVSAMFLRGSTRSIDQLVSDILSEVWRLRVGLILIDPVYRVYGETTDERTQTDVALIMRCIERVAVEGQCAVVFVAHYAKGDPSQKFSIDRVAGSSVFSRAPDGIATLTRHELDDHFVVEATLRSFPPVEEFVVRWNYPLFERQAGLDPTRLRKPGGGRKPEHDSRQFLGALIERGPLTMSSWADECGLVRRTLCNYARAMRASGWIQTVEDEHGIRQAITDEGRKVWESFNGGKRA
ncbi:MAG: AAA family ATPase [Verrucomicrobia bacterium]|nr:AAA family ATPase [Verrucomicrobiota bacterium]